MIPLARRYPANPDVGGRADAVDQLRSMMLDVADIDELVLKLGHAIPTEATLGAVEIQRLHGVINHPIAELPVLEHLRLRVRLTAGAVAFAMMLFPQPERSFVVLEIQVREEQRVVRQLPERILVVVAQPLLRRAALDGFAEHRQRRVILALQDGSKHRMRVAHRLRLYSEAAFTGTCPFTVANRDHRIDSWAISKGEPNMLVPIRIGERLGKRERLRALYILIYLSSIYFLLLVASDQKEFGVSRLLAASELPGTSINIKRRVRGVWHCASEPRSTGRERS